MNHTDNKFPFAPKESAHNKHDMAAASFFYQHCQMIGVPLIVVNKGVSLYLFWYMMSDMYAF